MKSIKFIDNDGVVEGFTSLEELELHRMPKLEGWSLLKVNEESDVIMLPCLKKLNIDNCPKLMKLPFSFSVESLVVWGCGESIVHDFGINGIPITQKTGIPNGIPTTVSKFTRS
ncbi:hypothetical protein IFM89_005387 [Coptis chinensis]|uniref:Uncharacterized protein n=1 Tax=Coptis chinensis TaxID=261450 RepID=A0A835IW79_9MAGN|nr:hypothetical protein IFM89_005387 [Coptis chinensis]